MTFSLYKNVVYIYFYIAENKDILYVGQSVNVRERIIQHNSHESELTEKALFVFYFPVAKEDADIIESAFITLYNPEYNKNYRKKFEMDYNTNILISMVYNNYYILDKLLLIPQGRLLRRDLENTYNTRWEEIFFDIFGFD